jgi:hypothetical protein
MKIPLAVLAVVLVVTSLIVDYQGRKWIAGRNCNRQEGSLPAHLPLQ